MSQINLGDKVHFLPLDEQESTWSGWRFGRVIGTSTSDPWLVSPGTLRVSREGKDSPSEGVTIPIARLVLVSSEKPPL